MQLSARALFADSGIPMLALTYPAMLALLVPVIVVETVLCKKWMNLTWREAIKANALSNIVSTVIGIPIAWAILLIIELGAGGLLSISHFLDSENPRPIVKVIMFIFGAPWIGSINDKTVWLIPAATLILLVPFFLISWRVEYWIVSRMYGVSETPAVRAYPHVSKVIRNVNLVTYGAMFVATSVWLVDLLKTR